MNAMNPDTPAGNPDWQLVDSPVRPDCVPEDGADRGGVENAGGRLHLPTGWHYRVRQLAQECVLRTNGQAYLIRDDFENSYQRVG